MMTGTTRVTHHRPRRAWSSGARVVAAAIAMAGLALLAAACGGGPTSTAARGSAPAAASASSRSPLAFADCMRSDGVPTWPDPTSDGRFDKSKLTPQQLGVTAARIEAAQRACQHLLPNGGNGPTPAQVRQYRNAMLKYAQCIRAHGIKNMPDPDSRGRLHIGPGTDVNVNTPQFRAARQACLPQLSPPPRGGGNG